MLIVPQDPAPDTSTVAVWEVELNWTSPVTPRMFRGARNWTQEIESEKDNKEKVMIILCSYTS